MQLCGHVDNVSPLFLTDCSCNLQFYDKSAAL